METPKPTTPETPPLNIEDARSEVEQAYKVQPAGGVIRSPAIAGEWAKAPGLLDKDMPKTPSVIGINPDLTTGRQGDAANPVDTITAPGARQSGSASPSVETNRWKSGEGDNIFEPPQHHRLY